jgi:ribosomal protein S18 acetylase RimI-like enzyme
VHELSDRQISSLVGNDPLRRWVAQDRSAATRAWCSGDGTAAAIARPGLAQRDRVLVLGEESAAANLLRDLLPLLGPTYRPFGDRHLVDHILGHVPRLERRGEFYWMWCSAGDGAPAEVHPHSRPCAAGWAEPGDAGAIAALLARNFPDSYARPGRAGVQRWAKITLGNRIVATGAWAWSEATVGLISGVTVESGLRGKGLGRSITSFLVHEALRTFGTASLLADEDNIPAIALYRSMGLRSIPLLAARARGHVNALPDSIEERAS